jgi:putative nucleotidyltransferase with HDIG domain
VKQAIVAIGLDETIAALNYFLVRKLFPPIPHLPGFAEKDFWQHSLGCACVARMLGHPQYLTNCMPGDLYLAGLLHDIGKLVLAIHLPEEFGRCLDFCNRFSLPLEQIEYSSMGVDHAVVGAHLLDGWNIPDAILNAIAFHHYPEQVDGENSRMTALIELADLLINEWEIGNSGNPKHKSPGEAAIHKDSSSPLSNEMIWEKMLQSTHDSVVRQLDALSGDGKTRGKARSETVARGRLDQPVSQPGGHRSFFSFVRSLFHHS